MTYKISGIVIHGDGYGKKLGFPTVNLGVQLPSDIREGVYSGTAILDGITYPAGIVVGPGEKIEAHLIGYSGNAYGKEVTLETKEFLRGYKKFDTEEELILQIRKDLERC